MKKQRENRHLEYFWMACIASVVIHIMFLSAHINLIDKVEELKKNKVIKIILMDDSLDKEKLSNKQKEDNRKKQIVNTEQQKKKERPDRSRFLSKNNQSFARQTKAKVIGSFKRAGKGKRNAVDKLGKYAKNKKPKKKILKKKSKLTRRKKLSLSDLTLQKIDYKASTSAQKSLSGRKGLDNGDILKRGLAQSNDFIEDIPMGDMTHLNTIEFKYFSFYDRIRKKLERFWGNSLRKKARELHGRGRRLPANSNIITSLIVTLDSKGNIVHVRVKSTSGIMELDEAAVNSFNRAGPFPNPPQGMIKDGRAKIEWGFVVKS